MKSESESFSSKIISPSPKSSKFSSSDESSKIGALCLELFA
jgi:hypothetical protein